MTIILSLERALAALGEVAIKAAIDYFNEPSKPPGAMGMAMVNSQVEGAEGAVSFLLTVDVRSPDPDLAKKISEALGALEGIEGVSLQAFTPAPLLEVKEDKEKDKEKEEIKGGQ